MNHRIENLIIEPFEERRAEQYSYMGNGTLRCDGLKPMHEKRHPWHDYSTKKELVTVYVPVEPEPEWLPGEEKFWNIKINCPFSPQDIIVVREEWYKHELHDNPDRASLAKYGEWQPPSTMPTSLDSQCKQYEVIKVIGVEEIVRGRKIFKKTLPVKRWHFHILASEVEG